MLTRTLHPKGFLEFWIDARFYLGWALGLLMTPFPFHTGPHDSATARQRWAGGRHA
jgi:hypothetical protein